MVGFDRQWYRDGIVMAYFPTNPRGSNITPNSLLVLRFQMLLLLLLLLSLSVLLFALTKATLTPERSSTSSQCYPEDVGDALRASVRPHDVVSEKRLYVDTSFARVNFTRNKWRTVGLATGFRLCSSHPSNRPKSSPPRI